MSLLDVKLAEWGESQKTGENADQQIVAAVLQRDLIHISSIH